MTDEIKRQIILDNLENPYNKKITNEEGYDNVLADNTSCIDKFNIEIKIENNIIKDMHFDGEGCALSTSSTSIMLKLFKNKTIDEALEIIDNFEKMLDEKEYDSNILEEANVYSDTNKQPARKKCVLLPYESIKKYLKERKGDE